MVHSYQRSLERMISDIQLYLWNVRQIRSPSSFDFQLRCGISCQKLLKYTAFLFMQKAKNEWSDLQEGYTRETEPHPCYFASEPRIPARCEQCLCAGKCNQASASVAVWQLGALLVEVMKIKSNFFHGGWMGFRALHLFSEASGSSIISSFHVGNRSVGIRLVKERCLLMVTLNQAW